MDQTDPTMTQIASTCWECNTLCGSLVTIRHGRATGIGPNPAHPASKGAFCVKGVRGLPELTYGSERLLHPMRRTGPRGSGAFEQISWNQAFQQIGEGFAATRREYGAQALVGAVSGAFYSRGLVMALLLRSMGSPNWMINQDLCGGCRGVSEMVTGLSLAGGEDIDNTHCTLVVGTNPQISNPVQWLALKRARQRGARLVVIDPVRNAAADMADLWLCPKPGTDAAILLAMIHVLISENLHDREFVARWCHGFAELSQRAATYSATRAAEISGVPADQIVAAARLYGQGPSALLGGHGVDAASNGVQAYRALHCLVAISGNIDRVGGNRRAKRPKNFKSFIDLLHDPDFSLPPELASQALGAQQFPLWAGPDGWQTACHNPTVINAILTGQPYKVRAMYVSGVNIAVTYPDTRRTLAALRSLDHLVVATHSMNPTAALADIILPKTTGLEEEELALQQQGPCLSLTNPVAVPQGKALPDIEIAAGIMAAMRQRNALHAELLPWQNARALNDFLLAPTDIDRAALAADGFARFPYRLGAFETDGFRTPSGKIELSATKMAMHGLDPLPDYRPPAPAGQPDAAYPLLLQTGQREKTYHHSRFRDQAWALKISPDPLVQINPATAQQCGLQNGDWVRVELAGGRGDCRLKLRLSGAVPAGMLVTGMGWWRPQATGPEFGACEININAALSYGGPYDPASGSPDLRLLPCRVGLHP